MAFWVAAFHPHRPKGYLGSEPTGFSVFKTGARYPPCPIVSSPRWKQEDDLLPLPLLHPRPSPGLLQG